MFMYMHIYMCVRFRAVPQPLLPLLLRSVRCRLSYVQLLIFISVGSALTCFVTAETNPSQPEQEPRNLTDQSEPRNPNARAYAKGACSRYRGTSLIRNIPPPRTTIGPYG